MPHKPIPIRVRDFRKKGFWLGDDVYLNSYAKHLDPFTTAIYFSLCRHADTLQKCFPSQRLLAEEHNIGIRTVISKVKLLEKWNIVKVKKIRTKGGKWLNNTYFLLDKSEWKKLPSAGVAHGSTKCRKLPTQVQELHIKDTHTKDTHTLSIQKLVENDFQEIADKYQVPMAFVRSKYDDMVLWVGQQPKNPKLKNRNWKLTLMKWVKTDAIKVKERSGYANRTRGIDATNL